MTRSILVAIIVVATTLSACEKGEPPVPETSLTDAPVKNVESLPSGTIREGARTMNQGADMGADLEQQKQERNKEIE